MHPGDYLPTPLDEQYESNRWNLITAANAQ